MSKQTVTIQRTALVESLQLQLNENGRLVTIVAPSGYGKSTLLKQLETAFGSAGTVHVDMAKCANHPGLFVDHLVRGVLRWDPDASVETLLAVKGAQTTSDYVDGLTLACKRLLDARGWPQLTCLLDRADTVDSGSAVDLLLRALVRMPDTPVKTVIASRLPVLIDGLESVWGQQHLALDDDEIQELFVARRLAKPSSDTTRMIREQTEGWPVAVQLYADVLEPVKPADWRKHLGSLGESGPVGARVAEGLLGDLSPTVRYFARVLSVLDSVDLAITRAVFTSPDSGQGLSARGRMVALPAETMESNLAVLVQARLLSASAGAWSFNPLVRNALRARLKREDPAVYREANRRAAQHHLGADELVSHATLGYLHEASEFELFMNLLEREGPRLLKAGHHRMIARWLDGLESRYAVLPIWANHQLANNHSLRGNWEQARSFLERCKAQLSQIPAEQEDLSWQPRINMSYAVMCARRGMHADARTYCRRGLDYIRQVRRRVDLSSDVRQSLVDMQLQLLDRLGTNKYAAGLLDKAWEVFCEYRELASVAERGDLECKALMKLGTVAHLRGSLATAEECLLRAHMLVDPETEPIRVVEVTYALGWTYLDMEVHKDSEDLLLEAQTWAEETGHFNMLARIRATLGSLYYLCDRLDESKEAFSGAYALVDSIGNLGLRGEILDWYVIFLARIRDIARARALFTEADQLIGGKLRAQPPLAALHKEAEAELHFMEGRTDKAIRAYTAARNLYETMGAQIALMRTTWRLAEIEHESFVSGRSETPEAVFEYLGAAIEIAVQANCMLPIRLEVRELLEVGYQFGGPEVAERCLSLLVDHFGEIHQEVDARWNAYSPSDAEGDEEAPSAIVRYKSFEAQLEDTTEYWMRSREEVLGLCEGDLLDLQEDYPGKGLLVLLHQHHLDNFGLQISLAQKRVILPLLVHFLDHHDEDFTMGELAKHVWGATELDPSMRTKVKVAISRLRSLLGKRRNYVVTGRRQVEGKKSEVTYALSPRLDFRLIGLMGDEYCPTDLMD